ncbi:MAG: TIM barrel protein [Phycisphaerales bacterium]
MRHPDGQAFAGSRQEPSRVRLQLRPLALLLAGDECTGSSTRSLDRIFHCHIKDCARTLDGTNLIPHSHLAFGHPARGWDFRSPGRGHVEFEEMIRALNRARYEGPLSVEWEDVAMRREDGAAEAVGFVRSMDFPPSHAAFDAAFSE